MDECPNILIKISFWNDKNSIFGEINHFTIERYTLKVTGKCCVVPASAKWRLSQFCGGFYLASCRRAQCSQCPLYCARRVITIVSGVTPHFSEIYQRYQHGIRAASRRDFEAVWPVGIEADQGLWPGRNNWSSSPRIRSCSRHQAQASQQDRILPGLGKIVFDGKFIFLSIPFLFRPLLWYCIDTNCYFCEDSENPVLPNNF